jgi:hypothetical protein
MRKHSLSDYQVTVFLFFLLELQAKRKHMPCIGTLPKTRVPAALNQHIKTKTISG